MPVIMEVSKPLDGNRVEVHANYNGISQKNFSVEKDKADEFISSYKKTHTKLSLIDTAAMCISGGLGGIAGAFLGKNLNGWKKWGATALGGLAAWTVTAIALSKPLDNMLKNVEKKFGAEIIPSGEKKPTNA